MREHKRRGFMLKGIRHAFWHGAFEEAIRVGIAQYGVYNVSDDTDCAMMFCGCMFE